MKMKEKEIFVRPLTCVGAFVDVEVGFLRESLVTDVAGERTVTHMGLLVLYQVPIGGQYFVAVVAGVGHLAVVALHPHHPSLLFGLKHGVICTCTCT